VDVGWQRRGVSVFMAGDVLGQNRTPITMPLGSLDVAVNGKPQGLHYPTRRAFVLGRTGVLVWHFFDEVGRGGAPLLNALRVGVRVEYGG
jgi:hypothetical protein